MRSAARLSLVAAVLTMIMWGVNFAVTKYVVAAIGVGPFLCLRFMIMPVLGFATLLVVYRKNLRAAVPHRADWPRFAAAGLIGHTVHVGVITWGIDLSTAFSSSLVMATGPIMTLLILAVMRSEPLRRQHLAGTAVAFVGIVVFLANKFATGVARAGLGDLVLLAAAAFFSVYTVLIKPLAVRYGPLPLLVWTLAVGSPPLVLLTAPSLLVVNFDTVPPGVWIGVLWASAISSFCGWLVWGWVNAVRGVGTSAPLMYLMPPVSGVAAWLLTGEEFTALKLAGAAVTLAGVAAAQFGSRQIPVLATVKV